MNDEQGLIEIIKKMSLYLDNYNTNTSTLDEFIENIAGLNDHYEFSEDSEYDEELVLNEIILQASDIVENNDDINIDQFGVSLEQRKLEIIDKINEYLNNDFEILNEINEDDDYDDNDLSIDPYDDLEDS